MGERKGLWEQASLGAWTAVCIAWLLVIWTWSALHLAMTVDDTYYYFKTALHVSRGLGSSFDGINPTDGYHPLWLAILAAVFKVVSGDMVLLTRVVFTLQVVMVWVGGLWLARLKIAGGAKILWPLALVLANPFSAKIVLCGQETALQFLLSSAALALWWRLRESPGGYRPLGWAGLALVCVLATLSRLDTVFFCGALLAMPLVLPSERERSAGLPARLKTTVAGFVVFGCGLGAFLAYHYATFHHLMPVSGAIKAHLEASEIAPSAARVAATLIALATLAGVWLAARRRGSAILALLAPPIAGALFVSIYNFGVRGEMSPRLIRVWYLEPYLVAGILVIGALLITSTTAGPRRAITLVALGAAALWLAGSVVAWRYRLQTRSYSLYQAAERCSRWAEAHPEIGGVGAAWDAGFAGAFTRRPVMNLDGLINSWEYKEQYLDRGQVDEFIFKRQPVDFVIQYLWPGTLRSIAARADREALIEPQMQTTVTGLHDRDGFANRWGVDLASFTVAHIECVPVSVAYDPTATVGAVFYFVLTRAPLPDRLTLGGFAQKYKDTASCDAISYGR